MPYRVAALCAVALAAAGLTACGSETAEAPREQIIVAKPGEAASPAPTTDPAEEPAPEAD